MVKRRFLRTVLVAVAVIVLLLTMAWWFQRQLIYFPDTSAPPVPDSATEVELRTSDDLKLAAWQFAPTGADRKTAVLVANGNGGNRLNRIGLAEALTAKGFTVLVFDYRGYGGNPGSPDEDGLYADAKAALDHLTGPAGFDTDRIVYFGESLGCGVVSKLALDHPPAAMVLRSPFTSLPDVGQRHYPYLPVRLLLTETYPVESNVTKTGVPLLVAYGTGDSIVPPDLSKRVAESAENSGAEVTKLAIDGADHNELELVGGAEVIDGVATLADSAGLTAR
ncbi:alpha/beta hydrolase [Stackebrandtia nassauensis]|uniref:AB hydrolase-1 domain-containing protein n=1 Tax=Stackebrandtia nassauensis (strain DSM 44728 / CIP 108903 / NRRL B-16338 / NBRC 102104 / LLR-40K-21) TaxID=446470 RepID=D3PZZ1_STANL|nr:alpha/beta fold hydrolase [Stackebrandtia nassauensis]ADD43678.1 conserved hypothetical protein [Stackebrandtia nassauensis DSM 44728]